MEGKGGYDGSWSCGGPFGVSAEASCRVTLYVRPFVRYVRLESLEVSLHFDWWM